MDVKLFNTDDGGDIDVTYDTAGYFNVTLSAGLETAVYLSLFGGSNWWGNIGEQPARQYNSKTEAILSGYPMTTGNLLRLEEAIRADLQWMTATGAATSVDASASIIDANRVQIDISVNAEDNITYILNWAYDTNN